MINILFMDIGLLVASQVTPLTATLDTLFGFMCTSCMVFVVICFPFKDLLVIHCQCQTNHCWMSENDKLLCTLFEYSFLFTKQTLCYHLIGLTTLKAFFNYGTDVFKTQFVRVQMNTWLAINIGAFMLDRIYIFFIGIVSLILVFYPDPSTP